MKKEIEISKELLKEITIAYKPKLVFKKGVSKEVKFLARLRFKKLKQELTK